MGGLCFQRKEERLAGSWTKIFKEVWQHKLMVKESML